MHFYISYTSRASDDVEHARWIKATLEEDGHRVTYHGDFFAGDNLIQCINKSLCECDKLIIVYTDNYQRDILCQSESSAFLSLIFEGTKEEIIPVIFDKTFLIPDPIYRSTVPLNLSSCLEENKKNALLLRVNTTKPIRVTSPILPFDGKAKNNIGPSSNNDYTPRNRCSSVDIAKSFSSFDNDSTGRRIFLCGMAGVGKTEIALHYADKSMLNYGLIWWVEASSENGIIESLALLAQELNINEGLLENSNLQQRASLALGILSEYRGWLLIYDNVTPSSSLSQWIPKGSGDVLLTARPDSIWGSYTTPDKIMCIDVMNKEEAGSFLTKCLNPPNRKRPEPTDKIQELSRELGYLPLALLHAARYIMTTKTCIDSYLKKIKKKRKTINSYGEFENSLLTVATTFLIAYEALEEEYPKATNLLKSLSFYAPVAFPRQHLNDTNARIVRELSDHGLLRIWDTQHVVIHSLVQEVVMRFTMDENERIGKTLECTNWLSNLLSCSDETETSDIQIMARNKKILVHAQALLKQTVLTQILKRWPAHVSLEASAKETFRNNVGKIYKIIAFLVAQAYGNYSLARKYHSRAIIVALKTYPVAVTEVLENKIGFADTFIHDSKDLNMAIGILSEILESIDRDRFPKEIEKSRIDLGTALYRVGQYKEAQTNLFAAQKELEAKKATQGLDDESSNRLAEILNVLGNIELDKREYKEALCLYEKSLKHRRYPCGRSYDLKSLATEHNIGNIYNECGDYPKAEKQYRKVIEARTTSLGAKHPVTLSTQINLANVYFDNGQYDEAIKRYLYVRRSFEEIHQKENQYALTNMVCLARTLLFVGKYQEANPLLKETLALREKALGKDHKNTITAKYALGYSYYCMKEYEDAEKLILKSIHEFEENKNFDANFYNLLDAKLKLANVYYRQGKYDDAIELYDLLIGKFRESENFYANLPLVMNDKANCLFHALGKALKVKHAKEDVLSLYCLAIAKMEKETQNLKGKINMCICQRNYFLCSDNKEQYGKIKRKLSRILPCDHPYKRAKNNELLDCILL